MRTKRDVIVCALLLSLATLAGAQATALYTKKQLRTPIFWTVGSPDGEFPLATATCQATSCFAETDMFFPYTGFDGIVCPLPAGSTCWFYLSVEGGAVLRPNAMGLYHIVVDGKAINPGPTQQSAGYIIWGCNGYGDMPQGDGAGCLIQGLGSNPLYEYTYVSGLAKVTNTTANQAHTFHIFEVCQPLVGLSGCSIDYWRGLVKFEVFQ